MTQEAGGRGRRQVPRRRADGTRGGRALRRTPAPAPGRLAVTVMAVTAAAAVAAAPGCGNAPAPTATGPPATDAPFTDAPAAVRPVPLDSARLGLPLDPYLLGPREAERVARAYRILLAQCTERFGITIPDRLASPDGPATLNERRYGITDAALAAAAGYRVSVRPPASAPPRPTDAADPRTLEVLTGTPPRTVDGEPVPDGGCSGEARRRLNPGVSGGTDLSVAERLAQTSYFDSRGDRRVAAALRAWSACMRGHGYDYPSPLDAAADPRFRAGEVTATEIAVAMTDIACKKDTNLVGVWHAVEAELQRPVIIAHRDALERVRRANEVQIGVARALGLG